MVNVTATYTLQPDGSIKVENAGYRNGVFKKQPDVRNSPIRNNQAN